MARGFESKSVEFQQEEAARAKRPAGRALTPAEQEISTRVRTLQLALARAEDDLSRAAAPAHRRMLEQAISALQTQIVELQRQS
jgi:hypothetical protein